MAVGNRHCLDAGRLLTHPPGAGVGRPGHPIHHGPAPGLIRWLAAGAPAASPTPTPVPTPLPLRFRRCGTATAIATPGGRAPALASPTASTTTAGSATAVT